MQNNRQEHFASLYLVLDSCLYVVFLSSAKERQEVNNILGCILLSGHNASVVWHKRLHSVYGCSLYTK